MRLEFLGSLVQEALRGIAYSSLSVWPWGNFLASQLPHKVERIQLNHCKSLNIVWHVGSMQ